MKALKAKVKNVINVSKPVYRYLWRVGMVTLSIICITGGNKIVYGQTSDDVRELIGEHRLDNKDYIDKLNNIVLLKQRADELGSLALAINSIDFDESTMNKINKLKAEEKEIAIKFSDGIKDDTCKPEKLFRLLEEYNKVALELDGTGLYGEGSVEGEDLEAFQASYNNAIEELSHISDGDDIGNVCMNSGKGRDRNRNGFPIKGNDSQSSKGTRLVIYEPYGEMRDKYNLDETYMNNGIYFKTNGLGSKNKPEITAPFNGVIKEVVISQELKGLTGDELDEALRVRENQEPIDKSNWGNYVVIQSGRDIESSISYIDNIEVKAGQEVKQGDILGRAYGKFIYEEVKYNGVLINPIYLYGKDGRNAYNEWVSSNNERVIDIIKPDSILENTQQSYSE